MFLIPASWYQIKTIHNKGRGVFAKKDIPAGTVIGDYEGIIVRPEDEDEATTGLYTIAGGRKYDILANPKEPGIHYINHSCISNSGIYPYRGHMLFVTLRKIFAGEEITISYTLGKADAEEPLTCANHACYCNSILCSGSMHDAEKTFAVWEKFLRRQFGSAYEKLPAPYGQRIPRLATYPKLITKDEPTLNGIFGSESKTPQKYNDVKLPSVTELRKRIRETGRRAAFPKIGATILGADEHANLYALK